MHARTPFIPTILAAILIATFPLISTAETVPIDVNHSTLGFSVPIFNGISEVTGKFTEFEVDFNLNPKDFTKSKVNVTIQAKSVSTGITQRDGHLRGRDFFGVRDHPEITFKSNKIEATASGHRIYGDLTMLGKTHPVEVDLHVAGVHKNEESGRANIGFIGVATIDRELFGMTYQHQTIDGFIGTKIKLILHILTKSVDIPLDNI